MLRKNTCRHYSGARFFRDASTDNGQYAQVLLISTVGGRPDG